MLHICMNPFEVYLTPEELQSRKILTGPKGDLEELILSSPCQYCGAPATGGAGALTDRCRDYVQIYCQLCRSHLLDFEHSPLNIRPIYKVGEKYDPVERREEMEGFRRAQLQYMEQRIRARSRG